MPGLVCLIILTTLPGLASAAQHTPYREVYELTGRNFNEKTSDGTWLVLFYAPWCGHCKKMQPAYERVAEHYHRSKPQRIRVARLDATQHPTLAELFDVKGYPTVVLLQDGERVLPAYSGERTFDSIVEYVDEQLGLPTSVPRGPSAPKVGSRRPEPPPARPKTGAAARYLKFKATLYWLLTDADPITVALTMLGGAVSLGAGLVITLLATTAPSAR
mmetsp:Transcript_41668/g.109897  ORF Transcript_41668/g.109897 Transcript_41668/m.109897 type:complete len:217 (-) Transcript_41668:476-1126(-)